MPYTTRPAVPADRDVIARYNAAMALETESKTLDLPTLTAGVQRVFDEPGLGRYFVAEHPEAGVVGCAMVTDEWSDWRNGVIWWLQSVYVHPDHRRRGVFSKIYHAIRAAGDEAGGVIGYRLYVEHDNAAAKDTYRELGMSPGGYEVYEAMGGCRATRTPR